MTTPESYLALLRGTPHERNHTEVPDTHRRTLDLLDALALVCVRQKTGEVIAVGLELPQSESHPVRLYISGNCTLDGHTRTHLKEICNELATISCLESLPPDRSPKLFGWPDDVVRRRNLLASKILGFCHEKVLKRWKKREKYWADYTKVYREILTSRNEFAAYVEKYDLMIKGIDKGREIIQEDPRHSVCLDGLAEIMRNEGFRSMIKEIDSVILTRGFGWTLEHFVDKITEHVRSLDILVGFAVSRMRGLLSKPLILNFVDSTPRTVCIDITPIRGEFPSAFEGEEPFVSSHQQIRDTYNATPHCEVTLLAHFMDKGLFRVSAAIGVSKLSCFGCRVGLEALNTVVQAHCPEFPAPFFTSGEHTKIYPSYSYPTFFPRDLIMEGHMQGKLASLLREHFRQAADQHYINLSYNTISSFKLAGRPAETYIAWLEQLIAKDQSKSEDEGFGTAGLPLDGISV